VLLAALAYVPVLRSDPGQVAADTKQYLYLDPARLLERAWSMWDPNIGLGTVTHQTIGYLFPMGPFYWVFDALRVPDWVAQRLWLGSIIFAAGLGVLYLMRTLGRRGPGLGVAVLVYMLTPYLLDYSARISVILMPWAGLGWLLAFVVRGLRARGSETGNGLDGIGRIGAWRYPALFALVVQLVGGVNATALIFAGIAPVLWIPFAVWVTHEATGRQAWGFVWRTGVLTLVASLWWISGLWAQGSYGLDILEFTETIRAVSRTSLAPEVLRGLGYWFFYGQDKLGAWTESSIGYTQWSWLIVVSYSIPTLALLSAAFVRWRYRAYFALLVVVGVVIAVGTYPYDAPSPAGGLFQDFAKSSSAGLALRSSGRATPLVVLGLAVLLAAGVDALHRRVAGTSWKWIGVAAAGLVMGLAILNLPSLWQGTFYGANLERDPEIPQYWEDAIAAADAGPHDTRILEVPGTDFASYTWGNTVDPITPGLTDRPYVARELIPWGSPASADLVNAFDRQMQEGVLASAAIAPFARLVSAGDVLVRGDLQTDRYNLVRSRSLWRLFDPTPEGLGDPKTFGNEPSGAAGRIDEAALGAPANEPAPPSVALFPVDDPTTIIRSASPDRPVILSGDGEGIVDAASVGLLPGADRAVLYSATFAGDPKQLEQEIDRDATLVVTDSNRKRARRWSTVRDNTGSTETASERPLAEDLNDARLEVFPDAGIDAYTTVEQRGVELVRASGYGNPISYTAEDRAARAFDGDSFTAWKVGAFSPVDGEHLEVRLDDPITTDRIDLVQPLNGPRDRWITSLRLRFDGTDPVTVELGDASRTEAGQTVRFPNREFRTLDLEIVSTNRGNPDDFQGVSAVGLAEVRMHDDAPGAKPVRVDEVMRMPTDLVRAAATDSIRHPLIYTMTRERTLPLPPRYDPELTLDRVFEVPGERSFAMTGTVRFNPAVADSRLDELFGIADAAAGGVTAESSARLPGDLGARASSAIDGDPTTAWQSPFGAPAGQSISLTLAQPVTFDELDLVVFADGRHSTPSRLRITAGEGAVREVDVAPVPDGSAENAAATIPLAFEPITGTDFTVTVTEVHPREVIEYFTGAPVTAPVAIAELGVDGIRRAPAPATLASGCRSGVIAVDGTDVPVRLVGSTVDAERREGTPFELCAPGLLLTTGRHEVGSTEGRSTGVDVDRVALTSAAGGAAASVAQVAEGSPNTGTEVRAGAPTVRVTGNDRDHATVRVTGADAPFWFVLGESDNAGWRAEADGDDLGASTLVDGYANGWIVQPDAAGRPITISVRWTPQRVVDSALVISAGFGLVALGIVAWTSVRLRRRRRRNGATAIGADDPTTATTDPLDRVDPLDPVDLLGPVDPVLVRPTGGATGDRPGTGVLIVVPLVAGVIAGVFLQPWAAPILAAATFAALWWPRARALLRLFPAVGVGLCGFYILVQQYRHHFAPRFEWPTFFGRVNQLAWLAVLALAADVIIEIVLERRRRSRP